LQISLSLLPALVLTSSLLWIDIPFISQQKEGCGAATIAMVMKYWDGKGHSVKDTAMDADRIMQQLYTEEDKGIRAEEVSAYFEKNGFKTFVFSGTIEDLTQHISKGRPLIISVKAEGIDGFHYMVVAGMNADDGMILVNDPADRKLRKITKDDFEKRWKVTNNWTLLALPQ
jgi:ABC-type bacteriocin/lantibiotic exporter with double-glycine peptidase domain